MNELLVATIRTMWLDYMKHCLPPHPSTQQVIECRRAFYGGVWAFYTQVQCIASARSISDVDYEKWLDDIEKEHLAFQASVGTPLEGRAP